MEKPAERLLRPENIAKIGSLDLRARLIVEGFIAGLHKSPYHGFSVEFSQFRRYQPGDPVRSVDWKMFGKTDKIYIKEYDDETNLRAYLLLDHSLSMAYRHAAPISKLDYGKHLAAAIAHLMLRQQDAVGLVLIAETARTLIPARSAAGQETRILQLLEAATPAGRTDLGQPLHRLAEEIKKRSLIILFSDLLDDPTRVLDGIKHFRHNRHEVIVFHVLDPAECDFRIGQGDQVKDMEQETIFNGDPAEMRREYLKSFNVWKHSLEQRCQDMLADYFFTDTSTPFDAALLSFLQKRKRFY